MNKRMLIVLYGKKNQGKTTTLLKLVKLLTGITPPKGKDGRFIILYKGYYILICTGGDCWDICKVNTTFFEGGTNDKTTVWVVVNNEFVKLKNLEGKEKYKGIRSSVCITSCRPNGDSFGAIKAIHDYVEHHIDKYERMLWLQKEDNSGKALKDVAEQNASKKAAEIKKNIDDYLLGI